MTSENVDELLAYSATDLCPVGDAAGGEGAMAWRIAMNRGSAPAAEPEKGRRG